MIDKIEVDLKMASDASLVTIVNKIQELIDEENATIAAIQITNKKLHRLKKDFDDYKRAKRQEFG